MALNWGIAVSLTGSAPIPRREDCRTDAFSGSVRRCARSSPSVRSGRNSSAIGGEIGFLAVSALPFEVLSDKTPGRQFSRLWSSASDRLQIAKSPILQHIEPHPRNLGIGIAPPALRDCPNDRAGGAPLGGAPFSHSTVRTVRHMAVFRLALHIVAGPRRPPRFALKKS